MIILFSLLVTLFLCTPANAQLQDIQKAGLSGVENIVYNPGFEMKIAGWTASAGSMSHSTAIYGYGKGSGQIDASATGQTFTSKAVTIPSGMHGKNIVFGCMIKKEVSGTSTYLIGLFDGTTESSLTSITSSTSTFATTTVNTVAPSSGTLAIRIKSQADEPQINVDNCFISDASFVNVSQVNQATYVGSIKWAGTSSCSWSTSSASFANFAADADCPTATVDGLVTAPGTKIPAAVITNAQPGVYVFVAQGQLINSGSAGVCNIRFSDGTSNFGSGTLYGSASQNMTPLGLEGPVTYTTTQSSLTVNIQGRAEAGTCNLAADVSGREVSIAVYRYPLTSEIAIRPESMLQFGFLKYAGTANCTWIFSGASFANLALDADCPTPTVSGSGVAPGTKIPAMVVNNVPAGKYLVMVQGANIMGGGGDSCSMQIHDGTTGKGYTAVYNTTNQTLAPISLMGVFEYSTAQSTLTFNVQGRKDAGAGTCALANDAVRNLEISIIPISQSINVPLLVGSVTSGNVAALRIEAAELNCDASSAITSQTSSVFVATIGNRSSTSCAITFTAGTWSSAPYCTFSTKAAANSSGLTVTSTTAGTIFGPSADYDGYLTCIGVR